MANISERKQNGIWKKEKWNKEKWNKEKWQRIIMLLCCINFIFVGCVIFQIVTRNMTGVQELVTEKYLKSKYDMKGNNGKDITEKDIKGENGNTEANTKKVALTFDDGPNPDYTPLILDGLKERNVKATFFLLGEEVEEYPEIVKRMYEEGHLIGNHTYDHVNLGHLCEGAACDQVKKTNEIIEEVTGYYPEYVRPPFGEWKNNIDKDMTMIKVMWNVDPLDWATSNSDAVVRRVIQKCEDNDIILMHDASASSVKAALEIIDVLQKAGYEFVTVDQLILD